MTKFSRRLRALLGALTAGVMMTGAAQAEAADLLINVDTAGCSTNVAINNAIGQSFRVSSHTELDKLEMWIKPELYYTTSYAMELYDGEGTGGTRLATSPTTLTLNSQTAGTPSGFYAFSFASLGLTLVPNHAYTLKLVRLSQYSGAFSSCGNVYANGMQYWLGYSPDSPYDVSFKLFGTEVAPPPPPPPPALITVDTAGCSTNVAINNAIGQSFRVSSHTALDKLEMWIKPELYYTTSYAMELYDGEGTGGTRLATSPTTLTLNSQTAGTPSGFYAFSFASLGLTLVPNHAYTFKLVRLSQYSGAFSSCGNVYANGMQYWLGYSPDSPYDVSFKLFGTEVPPPPPPALISVDTAGCSTNVAINNAIGQSFRVSSHTELNKLEMWIKPELYYTTSYAMELYDGEGTGGTRLATSPTTLTLNSQTAGTPSGFYAFSFASLGLTLVPNHAYTFKLVRLSQYSGAFSSCGNVYANGMQYWLGYSPDSPYDVSFKLFGTEVAGGSTPPPTNGSFTYSASNTANAQQNTVNRTVTLSAGQTLQFGTCSVSGASGSGDTYLRLYGPTGAALAANDDTCGLLSFISYQAPTAGTYEIRAGCYSSGSCSGTVAYTIQ